MKVPAKKPRVIQKIEASPPSSLGTPSTEKSSNDNDQPDAQNTQTEESHEKTEEEVMTPIKAEVTLAKPPKLLYRDHKFIVGHGLSNIGNSCYMNSIIQVLANNHYFKRDLLDYVKEVDSFQKRPICSQLSKLITDIKTVNPNTGQSTISPNDFKQALTIASDLVSQVWSLTPILIVHWK